MHYQLSSVSQSCLTLCDPMGCSTPDFPVHHPTPKACSNSHPSLGNAIQPSHLLSSPSPPTFNLSQHQDLFQWVSSSYQVARILEFWASASVLPMNIQYWFPWELTGLISLQFKGVSRVFSNTTVQKHRFLALCFLYGQALTSIHHYWKNHSFDCMNICWQSNVSAF